jgi:hypothetical protein
MAKRRQIEHVNNEIEKFGYLDQNETTTSVFRVGEDRGTASAETQVNT